MSKLITPGRIMFALGLIALSLLQFFAKDYIIGRPPSPAWSAALSGKVPWAYISGVLIIIASVAIIFRKNGGLAAFFIGVFIFVCSFLLRHLPFMFRNTFQDILWSINAYKTLALAGGAFIIAASFLRESQRRTDKFSLSERLIIIGCVSLALFMVMSGLAHFKFSDFVNKLIPEYIPAHPFFTYFAGIALIAEGLGIILKRTRKPAALLSAIMILLWFILLHVPRAVNAPQDYGEWMGVFESFSFSGILFVLAGLSSGRMNYTMH